jgi:integrase
MTRHGLPIGDPDGRMTGQAVAEVIRRRASGAGLAGRFTGHSLRRGLATSMHRAGAEREHIERQGGWTPGSKVVAGYIEEEERWLNDVLQGVL